MRRPSRQLPAAALPLLAAACSSTPSGSSLTYAGMPGQPANGVVFGDVLLANISVIGASGQTAAAGQVAIDTGSPIVDLSPTGFPNETLPNGNGSVDTLILGGFTFTNPPVVGADLITSPDPTVPIDGIFGCTILCSFPLSLNYRDAQVVLGAGTTPSNVAVPGNSAAFQLQGGGTATLQGVPGTIAFPASRIAVTVTLEGTAHPFVLDSGASYVFLRSTVFTQLVSDGRLQIGGLSASTVMGMSTANVTRTRSLVVAGAEVDGAVASADTSIDPLLDGVAAEIGHPLDGLLGGTFLREFYVTIDYPARTLHLQRYATRDHIVDEFERVGVVFGTGTTQGYPVQQVLAGTDAMAKGVAVNDVIVSIDGQPLAPLGQNAASVLLSGAVGSTKMVGFGSAQSTALANQTVAIKVDELLPL